jgi:putative addiction module component (TIGR02574 family)
VAKQATCTHTGVNHERVIGNRGSSCFEALPAEERAELIERLIDTVLPPPLLRPAWEAEIARRIEEMDAGLVEGIPAEKVFADMRAMIEADKNKS